MIPDIEKLTTAFLRAQPAVAAAVGRRIVGKSPDDKSTAWVRLTRLDARGEDGSQPEHLIDFMVQLDCYAGADNGQPEANLIGRTVRDALVAMPRAAHTGAVVTRVRITGDMRRPDTDLEPARERVVLTATVHAHSTGGS